MSISAVNSLNSFVKLPYDLHIVIGGFLSEPDINLLLSTCREAANRFQEVSRFYSEREQRRLSIRPVVRKLTFRKVVERWQHFPFAAVIKIDIKNCPLRFYAALNYPLSVLSEKEIFAARNNFEKLENLSINAKDSKKAVVIANIILEPYAKSETLRQIAFKDELSTEDAVEIARRIPNQVIKDTALQTLALKERVSSKEVLAIASCISEENRSFLLRRFIETRNLPFATALEITDKIPNPRIQKTVLANLSKRNDAPDDFKTAFGVASNNDNDEDDVTGDFGNEVFPESTDWSLPDIQGLDLEAQPDKL